MKPSRIISDTVIEQLLPVAASSPRGRTNYNIHESYDESVQRFLNVLSYASYVRPHSHHEAEAWEGFIVVQGRLGVVQFDEDGRVLERTDLDQKGPVYGIELDSTIPHCITALSEFAVVFEYKQGPYIESTDKSFAAWAPKQDDDLAVEYSQWLKTALPGEKFQVFA